MPTQVDIVVPVYNEEHALDRSIRRLHDFLERDESAFVWHIVIVDNGSGDRTLAVAERLGSELAGVSVVNLDKKGRGRAVRAAWMASEAPIAVYMDVDLSTDLRALLPLVASLASGHSDLAIGTRLSPSSRVHRQTGREVISRAYNAIVHTALQARFTDAQCGFKGIRTETARELLPQVRDQEWFFDTELLVLAERKGLRIHEVAVDWVDDVDSRVEILSTAKAELRGVGRLFVGGPIGRFIGIGVLSTMAYALIFLLLRDWVTAGVANAIALAITAVGNTAANRFFTFGVHGTDGLIRDQLRGAIIYVLTLLVSTGALALLYSATDSRSHWLELLVLIAASACVAIVRYMMLRSWVFAPRRPPAFVQEPAPRPAD